MLNTKKIINDFKDLPVNFWDFSKYENHQYVHRMHNYPAVMIYPISRNILEIVSKTSTPQHVLDPFMGSGTIVVESQLAAINQVTGNDLNPLSHLIASAKTNILSEANFKNIQKLVDEVSMMKENVYDKSKKFNQYIKKNEIDIYSKDQWAVDYIKLTNTFFAEETKEKLHIKDIKNLGYWFKPEMFYQLLILKNYIDNKKYNEVEKTFIFCALSETIRNSSNTRNSEFKIYRMPVEKLHQHNPEVLDDFNKILNRNLLKMKEYKTVVKDKSCVNLNQESTLNLDNIKDDSVDLVITSPPYGDSKTTVAYGQFSRLSLQFLDILQENCDKNLLGGRKKVTNYDVLKKSPTLKRIYHQISKISSKRADEVYIFYEDLYTSFSKINKKVKTDGLQFWVVANRTVRKIVIPLDQILIEFSKTLCLSFEHIMYRNIGNKVMPLFNSPKDDEGKQVQTMIKESILIFRKT